MLLFQLLLDTNNGAITSTNGSSFPWVLIIVLVFALLGLLGLIVWRERQEVELYGMSKEKVAKSWREIVTTVEQGNMGAKLAVIEADKLLDQVLRARLFPGETMVERMKVAEYKYPVINEVWWAHKLRNQLVHGDVTLSPREAKRAIATYERVLKGLHVL